MPQFERNLYEPGDEPRVFDGSEDEDDIEGSRLPLLIVLALLVLAMFAGVVWLAYTQGVARGRTETPVLTAQAGPARIAPQNPGGAEQSYKGFKIYEQPAPPDDDAAAQAKNPAPPPAVTAASPAAAPTSAATPVAAVKPQPPVADPPPVVEAPPPKHIAAPAAAPARAIKPAQPIAEPAAKPSAPRAELHVAQAQASTNGAAIGQATAPPRALGVPPETHGPAAKPMPAEKPVAAPAANAAMGSTAANAATGAYVLQIGAYKSQADADAAWKSYKAKHAALLAGSTSDVQKADLGEKGTWYRLRIAGFPNKDGAAALCDRLKADGGSCFLGR